MRNTRTVQLFAAAILVATIAATAGAQVRLVKDIDLKPFSPGSKPIGLASIGNTTLFFASTEETGAELWATDGTERGTQLVRDIRPGPASSRVDENYSRYPAAVVGSRVVFPATDGEHGVELWTSDGTREGTRMLADLNPGSSSAVFSFGLVIGSVFYFRAVTPEAGYELWRTDGTAAGTRMVIDLNPGGASSMSYSSVLSEFGSQGLLFYARDGRRTGLFATDGTAEGTRFVTPCDDFFGGALGDRFFFVVKSGEAGPWTLLLLDQAGNTQVLRAGFSERPKSFTAAGDIAYFVANDGTTGDRIWRSDGTPAGTSPVAALAPGAHDTFYRMIGLGRRLLIPILANQWVSLWSSDGTAAGTTLLATLFDSWGGCVAGECYFIGLDDDRWLTLMKTDGTPEGTSTVAGRSSGVTISTDQTLVLRPNGVFLVANGSPNAGPEPWISDGTGAGTRLLKSIVPEVTLGSFPHALGNAGGKLLFRARETDSRGSVLSTWASDGTANGTSMVPSSSSLVPYFQDVYAVASGGLYYYGTETASETQLFRTDGTAAGTVFLGRIHSYSATLVPFRNGILWSDYTAEGNVEVWFSDGTAGGTVMLTRIDPKWPVAELHRRPITVVGDQAFFVLDALHHQHRELKLGSQVWQTDGTVAGTRLFHDDDTGPWRSPRAFTRVGQWTYFVSFPPNSVVELWRSHVGTGESESVRKWTDRSGTIQLAGLGDAVLLMFDGELWRSDGTTEGTTLVHDGISERIRSVTAGNGLVFWCGTAGYVSQVWRSDGTTEGTYLLNSFSGNWLPSFDGLDQVLHFGNDALFFPGRDPIHGIEPWVSDGTREGTRMLVDLNPGTRSSTPSAFLRIGDVLYAAAEEKSVGQEVWSVPIHCTGGCAPRRRAVAPR